MFYKKEIHNNLMLVLKFSFSVFNAFIPKGSELRLNWEGRRILQTNLT